METTPTPAPRGADSSANNCVRVKNGRLEAGGVVFQISGKITKDLTIPKGGPCLQAGIAANLVYDPGIPQIDAEGPCGACQGDVDTTIRPIQS